MLKKRVDDVIAKAKDVEVKLRQAADTARKTAAAAAFFAAFSMLVGARLSRLSRRRSPAIGATSPWRSGSSKASLRLVLVRQGAIDIPAPTGSARPVCRQAG
jgi:hypothetical protein